MNGFSGGYFRGTYGPMVIHQSVPSIADGPIGRMAPMDIFFGATLEEPLAHCVSPNWPSVTDGPIGRIGPMDGFSGGYLRGVSAPCCFTNLIIRHGWTDRTNGTDGRIFKQVPALLTHLGKIVQPVETFNRPRETSCCYVVQITDWVTRQTIVTKAINNCCRKISISSPSSTRRRKCKNV
jgi:hypothetical protein